MLALFASVSASNAAHWLQFAVLAGVVQRHYGVGPSAVNWTSMVFMAAYVPLVFPAAWITQRWGLRVGVALGAGLTAAGACLKVAGSAPHTFAVAFAGQSLVGAAQMFTLGAPARLAALWFPAGQVATACALGVFGNQVGIAVGFVLPPAMVSSNSASESQTTHELLVLHCALAAAPTLLFLLVLWLFEAAPPTAPAHAARGDEEDATTPLKRPPTDAGDDAALKKALEAGSQEALPLRTLARSTDAEEAEQGVKGAVAEGAQEAEVPFLLSLQRLAGDRDFLLLWLAYGLNVGVFYAVSTLLAQVLLQLGWSGAEDEAGHMGLAMVLAGVAGSVAGGLALDKWQGRYKEVTLLVYALALAGMLAFTFSLQLHSRWPARAAAIWVGFFVTGYVGVGYAYAAALTRPAVAESTSSGMLNAASEVAGVALTVGAGELLEHVGQRATNLALSAALALGLLLSVLVRRTDCASRRQQRQRQHVVEPMPPRAPPDKFLS